MILTHMRQSKMNLLVCLHRICHGKFGHDKLLTEQRCYLIHNEQEPGKL
uniref:Uncharacterized protein n=1 Tax=Arundo donax TaxID=35708 RepID=A0A0A8Z4Z5_ARUDO